MSIKPVVSFLIGAEFVRSQPPFGATVYLLGYRHHAVVRQVGRAMAVTGFIPAAPGPVPVVYATFSKEAEAWRWARQWLKGQALYFVGSN